MNGIWKGSYTYNSTKIQSNIGFPKTNFKIEITDINEDQFVGKVTDDIDSGGTPGIGDITGKLIDNEVSFIKIMPHKALIDRDGNIKVLKGKHPKIYYRGSLTADRKTIEGTWRFKLGFMMIGIIPVIMPPIKGKFTMDKQ